MLSVLHEKTTHKYSQYKALIDNCRVFHDIFPATKFNKINN